MVDPGFGSDSGSGSGMGFLGRAESAGAAADMKAAPEAAAVVVVAYSHYSQEAVAKTCRPAVPKATTRLLGAGEAGTGRVGAGAMASRSQGWS